MVFPPSPHQKPLNQKKRSLLTRAQPQLQPHQITLSQPITLTKLARFITYFPTPTTLKKMSCLVPNSNPTKTLPFSYGLGYTAAKRLHKNMFLLVGGNFKVSTILSSNNSSLKGRGDIRVTLCHALNVTRLHRALTNCVI